MYGWGGGPENFDFLGPNGTCFVHCHFRAQKSLDFHSPPIPMTLVLDLGRIEIIKSRAM
jgi:hypothetical protein